MQAQRVFGENSMSSRFFSHNILFGSGNRRSPAGLWGLPWDRAEEGFLEPLITLPHVSHSGIWARAAHSAQPWGCPASGMEFPSREEASLAPLSCKETIRQLPMRPRAQARSSGTMEDSVLAFREHPVQKMLTQAIISRSGGVHVSGFGKMGRRLGAGLVKQMEFELILQMKKAGGEGACFSGSSLKNEGRVRDLLIPISPSICIHQCKSQPPSGSREGIIVH